MDHDNSDNPFAYRRQPSRATWPWWIALVAVVLGTIVVAPLAVNVLLMRQLTEDLDSLPSDEHIERLQSIGQLGESGIPILVQSLSHSDRAIARSAYQVLASMQDDRMQKNQSQGARCHEAIARHLSQSIDRIPEDRQPWVRELLNKTLLDTLHVDSTTARYGYRTATTLLSQISLPPQVENETLIAAKPSISENSGRLVEADPAMQPLALEPISRSALAQDDPSQDIWVDPSQQSPSTTASLVETSTLLPAMLPHNESSPSESALPIGSSDAILSAGIYSANSPLEAYSTRAVIDLLSSIRKPLAKAARSELQRRGLEATELNLAVRLASTQASVRMNLIDEVTRRSDIDPRRWLLWLADDGERSVRLRALAALGTMDDPNITRELRALLATEHDPTVAARIRQALVR